MSLRSSAVLRALACGVVSAAAVSAPASQPRDFEFVGAAAFLAGELEGLSVDSEGRVSLAPAVTKLFDSAAPYVWSLALDARGTLYAGSGSDGQVFRVQGEAGAPFFTAAEQQIQALAAGPDGKLYVGSSPDGKVYAVDAQGRGSVFFDPPEKYIWALAFDAQGRLLVATGGEARLHRVDRSGQAEVLFESPETHFTALALDHAGRVYLGSAPGGVVYRLEGAGKAFVLADTPFGEVKALAPSADGTLYAALIDGGATAVSAPAVAVTSTSVTGEAQVTISETFAVAPGGGPTAAVPQATSSGWRGALMRFKDGDAETLWTSAEDAPHALVALAGGALVGTGDKGKLYRIGDDRRFSMLAVFPGQQVTALLPASDGAVAVGTSNSGQVLRLEARARERGSFTSTAQDTGLSSGFGRVRWEAHRPEGTDVQVQTRSGNTQSPDGTWSEWSPAYARAEGENASSPRARYVQVRATLKGSGGRTPLLESLDVAYLQGNLRPQVSLLTVHPAGQVFQKPIAVTGEMEVLGLEPPEAADDGSSQVASATAVNVSPYGRTLVRRGIQTLSWKADDPNQDALLYDLYYRRTGEERFRPLRLGLVEPVYAWDTTSLPDGRYVVKVVARDTPGNPPGLALAGERESVPFEIDNEPPGLVLARVDGSPPRVRVTARDAGSPIRRAEYAVDGQRWVEVYPRDGIADSLEESFELVPVMPAGAGPHVLVVRVRDKLGNVASAQLELR